MSVDRMGEQSVALLVASLVDESAVLKVALMVASKADLWAVSSVAETAEVTVGTSVDYNIKKQKKTKNAV